MFQNKNFHFVIVVTMLLFLQYGFIHAEFVPPAEWRESILHGNLLASGPPLDPHIVPYIGNGFLATNVYSDKIYLAGAYNGISTSSPSHRAIIRPPESLWAGVSGEGYTAYGLDLEKGLFLAKSLTKDYNITHTWYSSRTEYNLLAHGIQFCRDKSNLPFSSTVNTVSGKYGPSPDLHSPKPITPCPDCDGWMSSTLLPEIEQVPTTFVASVASPLPLTLKITIPAAATATANPEQSENCAEFWFYTVVTSNVTKDGFYVNLTTENLSESSWEPLKFVDDLVADFTRFHHSDPQKLLNDHITGWKNLITSGIRVPVAHDRGVFAGIVNSTQYYLLSSLGSPWSMSPGSLATNGYNGHKFWDESTWQVPGLRTFWPDLVDKSMLKYRVQHLQGAKIKAATNGYKGAMFPWESAFSGVEVCPCSKDCWNTTCKIEQHISSDIVFAFLQSHWSYTSKHDSNSYWFTHSLLPVLCNVADFWTSRVVFKDGFFHINHVIPPDEYAVNVDDSVYTNAAAATSLEWASKYCPNPDPQWLKIASGLYLPFDWKHQYYLEYKGYKGQLIKQADAVLIDYPLNKMPNNTVAKNTLDYYVSRTDKLHGPAMSWAVYSISAFSHHNLSMAAEMFKSSYAMNINGDFNVWYEVPGAQGSMHFITGAGGFLQSLINGVAGLRITPNSLTFDVQSIPMVSSISLSHFHYRTAEFTLSSGDDGICSIIQHSQSKGGFSFTANGKNLVIGTPLTVPCIFTLEEI